MSQEKRDVANHILRYSNLRVVLRPTAEGVEVPKHLIDQEHLTLDVGFAMRIPIPDLRVNKEGISGTLSFSGSPFLCRLPWHSIFLLGDHNQEGRSWSEDMPESVAVAAVAPGLRLIQGGAK